MVSLVRRRLAQHRARRSTVARVAAPPAKGPVGPPDFIGVGVQKAGTDWWHRLVSAHPAVHANAVDRKELHFFDERWDGALSDADVAAYHRFFPVRAGSITGEWTPRYVFDWWTPACLARAAPHARLMVVLRDPIERYRSGLAHRRALGGRVGVDDAADAFARGCYFSQLTRLGTLFARSQVLVLQFERCVADPAAELRRTYEFLGLDEPAFVPPRLARPINATRVAKATLGAGRRDSLRRAYEPEVRALADAFADIDLGLWPDFSSL